MVRRPPTKPSQTPGAQCDIKEASKITGLTVGSIYVYVREQIIPFQKINRRLIFNPEELRAWHALRSTDRTVTMKEAIANEKQNKQNRKLKK